MDKSVDGITAQTGGIYCFPHTHVAKHAVGNWLLSHYYILAPKTCVVLIEINE